MAVYNWIATSGGWSDSADWITYVNGAAVHGVPGPGDTADIFSGDVTVTTAVTAASLHLGGGTLNLGLSLTYGGAFFDDSNSALDLMGHALTLSGSKNIVNAVEGEGTVKVTGAAVVADSADGGYAVVGGGGVIEDAASMSQQGALALNGVGGGQLRVDAGATYAIAGASAYIDGGIFSNFGALTIGAGDNLDLNGGTDTLAGTLGGAGTLSVDATATLKTAQVAVGALHLGGGTLRLGLSLTYGGAFFDYSSSALDLMGYALTLSGSNNIVNAVEGKGRVKITGAAVVADSADGGYAVVGGGAVFEDAASVSQQGALALDGVGGGQLLVDAGATYMIAAASAYINGGAFTNNGALTIGAGDNLDLNGGTDTLGGTLGGAGALSVNATATLKTNQVTLGALRVGGGTLKLGVSLTYGGAFFDYSSSALDLMGYALTLSGSKNIVNEVSGRGRVKITGAAVVADSADGGYAVVGGGGVIEDAGSIIQQGALALNGVGGGQLWVDAGATYAIAATSAYIDGGAFTNFGALTIGAGDNLDLNGGTDTLGGTLSGAGALSVNATATLRTGQVTIGAIRLGGGALNLGVNLTYGGAFFDYSSSALELGGHTLTLSGSNTTMNEVEGAGRVKVTGAAVLADSADGGYAVVGGGAVIEDAASMSQQGKLALNGAGGGQLLVDAGATYTIATGGGDISGGVFVNNGALTIGAGDQLVLDGGVDTLGGTLSGAGTLVVNATATIKTGQVTLGAIDVDGGALTLDAYVSASEILNLQKNGELILGDLAIGGVSRLHGSISGFNLGVSVEALGFGTGTTFAYAGNGGKTGGVLTLTDGTQKAAINFLGDFTATNFHANIGAAATTFTYQS